MMAKIPFDVELESCILLVKHWLVIPKEKKDCIQITLDIRYVLRIHTEGHTNVECEDI